MIGAYFRFLVIVLVKPHHTCKSKKFNGWGQAKQSFFLGRNSIKKRYSWKTKPPWPIHLQNTCFFSCTPCTANTPGKCVHYEMTETVHIFLFFPFQNIGHGWDLGTWNLQLHCNIVAGYQKKEIFSPAYIQLVSCVGLETVDTDNSLTEVLCSINKY